MLFCQIIFFVNKKTINFSQIDLRKFNNRGTYFVEVM